MLAPLFLIHKGTPFSELFHEAVIQFVLVPYITLQPLFVIPCTDFIWNDKEHR